MKKNKKIKILVFIISYKASHRVLNAFNEIPFKKLKRFQLKVMISDDFSQDNTISFAKKIKKKYKNLIINVNKKNIGYGAHIKKCLNYAIKDNFNYAIMIHGDNQYSPKYIPSLLKQIKTNTGAVTGSRLFKGIKFAKHGGMPIYKLIGNIFLTKFYNILLKTNFSDAHTGLWLYNLNYLKDGNYKKLTDTFNFDQEFRFKNVIEKRDIKEISIKTRYGDERSQLHVQYAIKFFFNTIYFFLIKKRILNNAKFRN